MKKSELTKLISESYKEVLAEGTFYQDSAHIKDDVGKFWCVTKAKEKDTLLMDILFETTILGMYLQLRGGLDPLEIIIFTKDSEKAKKIAKGELVKYKK